LHLIAITVLKQVIPDEVAYNYFCEELENILYHRFGLKDEYEVIGVTDTTEKEMLRSAIVAVSHIVYLNACVKVLVEKNGSDK